ncbi:hypothetical protein [Dyella mobilis]|uniref:Uncharacterized protein n=1 Tax=Dyella mobilis TaxID=1849582 RepID=A0ABS2KLH3_9GAMM|nr:hypothetical protein [Dyella mobilis]MBM7131258.1 hypothetical protein [Dyella mobilis]GLQ98804.1 hypothetical protein GCM10007863_32240 [Dyella mobilis]
MYLTFALVAAGLAFALYPSGAMNAPLSQLTWIKICLLVFSGLLWLAAFKSLLRSFKKDRLWPWRWESWRDPATFLIRYTLAAFTMFAANYVGDNLHLTGWLLWSVQGLGMFCALWVVTRDELRIKSPEEKARARAAARQQPNNMD